MKIADFIAEGTVGRDVVSTTKLVESAIRTTFSFPVVKYCFMDADVTQGRIIRFESTKS